MQPANCFKKNKKKDTCHSVDVCLLYHINFNHLSLSFGQRVYYIEYYLEKLLDVIITPSTIAICAEDLLLLKSWNPECYQKLIKHSKLKFLLTPFNHVLPHLFPNYFIESVQLGEKILEKMIPKNKLLRTGYSPEVDLPQGYLLPRLAAYWCGLILGESRIDIHNCSKEKYPAVFLINDDRKGFKLKGYLSRRYTQYRDYLHRYLRAEVSEREVYEAIMHDYQKYSQGQPLLLRIDLEAFILIAYFL